jgi:hypothetical protein
MTLTRCLLVLALVTSSAALGCSHDDDHHHDAQMARTSGDEHDHDRQYDGTRVATHDTDHDGTRVATHDTDHDGTRVTTRDTDHDGTDDTVAVQGNGPTALDQGESESDVEITRQIRSSVVNDSSLSMTARNCVIITNGGHVTLRGNATSAESAAIERHAMHVAGVLHVQNDIRAMDQGADR